jgi:uncharacterized membrane protein HdeD (DUF308 family)
MTRPLVKYWWAVLLQGVVAIAFGLIAIFITATAVRGLTIVFGIYAIVDGVLAFLSLGRGTESSYGPRWTRAFQGVIGIIFGIAALVWPLVSFLTLLYLVAVWAIIIGAIRIIGAVLLHRKIERRWLVLSSGAVALIFGLAVIIRPEEGASAVMTIIGFFAVLYGIVLVLMSLQAFRAEEREQPHPGTGTGGG